MPFKHLDEPGELEWLLGWLIRLFARWRTHPTARQVSEFERALQLAKSENLRSMTLFNGLVEHYDQRIDPALAFERQQLLDSLT
jgi:hypothetical protein